jgi:hypothetical protein
VPVLLARLLSANYEGGGTPETIFQVFALSTNKNRAGVLGHGELPEAEKLVVVEWAASVYNKVHEMTSREVPVMRTDP